MLIVLSHHTSNSAYAIIHTCIINYLAEERQQRAKSTYLKNNIKGNSPWNTMYNKLVLHKEEHDGDMLVLTTKDSSSDLKKLAKWVQNQRVHYKYYMNGDTKFIKEDRIVALDKIGFVWNVNDHAWDANFQSLLNYHAEHVSIICRHYVIICSTFGSL